MTKPVQVFTPLPAQTLPPFFFAWGTSDPSVLDVFGVVLQQDGGLRLGKVQEKRPGFWMLYFDDISPGACRLFVAGLFVTLVTVDFMVRPLEELDRDDGGNLHITSPVSGACIGNAGNFTVVQGFDANGPGTTINMDPAHTFLKDQMNRFQPMVGPPTGPMMSSGLWAIQFQLLPPVCNNNFVLRVEDSTGDFDNKSALIVTGCTPAPPMPAGAASADGQKQQQSAAAP